MTAARPLILLIDDDSSTREVFAEALGDEGYGVETSPDGAAGLARIEAGGVDLVLLDLMLPGLHGLELLRRVREGEDGHHLPIIALTALADARSYVLAAGADGFVAKPFDFDELLSVIERSVRHRGA